MWASVSERSSTQTTTRISNHSQPESEPQKAKGEEHIWRDWPRTLDSDGFPHGSWTGTICPLDAGSQFMRVTALKPFRWTKVTKGLSTISSSRGHQPPSQSLPSDVISTFQRM